MSEQELKDLLNRREFNSKTVMALLSGVTVTISACSSSPTMPDNTPAPGGGSGDLVGTIGTNHGHTALLSQGDLMAGMAITLDIRGTSTHPHTVMLTAAEVVMIAGGGRVSKESSNDDGHTHTVTFN